MNKKIPTPLAILIILLVIAAIIGVAIWICPEKETENVACTQETKICPDGSAVGRTSPNCEFAECPEVKDETKGIVTNEAIEGVFEAKEWPYQPGDFYYYEINKDTKIVFICREAGGGSFPNGDVILEKNGNDFILLSNTELFGPGGEAFSVWATNNPDILLLRFVSGDMGWWINDEYYVDLAKKEIVFTLEDDQGHNLTVEKKGMPTLKLDLSVIDKCGDLEERIGKKAQIVDLLFNGQAANILQKPIETDCIDPGGIGPIYDPDFYLVKRKIEADFSKLEFALVGTRWEDGIEIEVWKEEFYIPLININDAKIYRAPKYETKSPEITFKRTTADWQIYRNEKYGFEVKYPIDWKMQERGDGVNYAELFYLEKEVGDSQFQFIDLGVDGDWYQVTRTHSEIIIDPTDANDPDSCLSNFVNVQREEIDFAGRKAISWKLLTEEGNVWRSHIKILNPPRDWKENNWILINYLIYDTGENCKIPVSYCSMFEGRVKVFCNTDKKDSEIVNQILSTFKFLD